jgi:hypothetical protein
MSTQCYSLHISSCLLPLILPLIPCHRRRLFFLNEHQLCPCVHKANPHSFLQPIQAQIPTTLLLATASTSQSLFSKFSCISTFTESFYCPSNPSAVYKHVRSHQNFLTITFDFANHHGHQRGSSKTKKESRACFRTTVKTPQSRRECSDTWRCHSAEWYRLQHRERTEHLNHYESSRGSENRLSRVASYHRRCDQERGIDTLLSDMFLRHRFVNV